MLSRYFIVISLTFYVSYASEENNNDFIQNNFDSILHEGKCEVKLLAAMSILKNETLYNNYTRFNMWKQNNEIEESLNEKLHKLEKNILDKLEEYIGGKLDSIEKHINHKTDALEKNIPDKTDINILNHKLDALNTMETELNGSIIRDSKTLRRANETLRRLNEELEKNISELENTTKSFKLHALSTKFTDLEGNVNRKLTELSKMIPDIKNKIERIDKRIPRNVEDINFNIDTTEKHNIPNMTTNQSCNCDTLNSTHIEELEKIEKKNVLTNRTLGYWNCKKREVQGYDYSPIRMDDETLDHVRLESDAAGGLTHFEMGFAIRGTSYAHIQLSPVPNPRKDEGYFIIQITDSNIYMRIGRPKTDGSDSIWFTDYLGTFDTPNLLVPYTYKALYIKIKNVTLEFGKAGSDLPILKYTDVRFRAVQYIGFTSCDGCTNLSFLYDCPPNFEETVF